METIKKEINDFFYYKKDKEIKTLSSELVYSLKKEKEIEKKLKDYALKYFLNITNEIKNEDDLVYFALDNIYLSTPKVAYKVSNDILQFIELFEKNLCDEWKVTEDCLTVCVKSKIDEVILGIENPLEYNEINGDFFIKKEYLLRHLFSLTMNQLALDFTNKITKQKK